MVLAFGDPNGDGFPDFFVGNDGRPSDLMLSEGGLRFRNAAEESGVAYGSIDGEPISAMSADWGDYDRDGRPDLFVTAFSNQPYSLLRATDAGKFVHMGDTTGITAATFKPLGFGAKWLDMDNDGWLDLAVANGHVHDNTEQIDPTTAYREPMMLLRNDRGRRFVDLLDKMEAAVRLPIVGRGLATGDFDNDGRVDVLVVDYEGKPLLLHNEDRNANHWITLSLIGARNRTAYGARVTARAGDQVWTGMVSPASSFLSSSDPRLHFGLGSVSTLDSVTVEWPSGRRQELARVATDRFLELREPTQPGKDGDR
jgi:hypothetical protein